MAGGVEGGGSFIAINVHRYHQQAHRSKDLESLPAIAVETPTAAATPVAADAVAVAPATEPSNEDKTSENEVMLTGVSRVGENTAFSVYAANPSWCSMAVSTPSCPAVVVVAGPTAAALPARKAAEGKIGVRAGEDATEVMAEARDVDDEFERRGDAGAGRRW